MTRLRASRFGAAGLLRLSCCVVASAILAACGKKGPPLEPLRLVPGAPTEISARRVADTMQIRFKLPAINANGPGAVDLGRVEIYAVTAAPGMLVPPNRELLTKKYLVGSIAVRPAPVEGEPEPESATKDPRPLPGEVVTFTEPLTPDTLTPAPLKPEPPTPPPTTAAAEAAAPAVAAAPVTRRIYAIRGMSRRGRPGQPAERVTLPLTQLPAAPSGLDANFTEKSVTLTWTPSAVPGAETATPAAPQAPAIVYNVYSAAEAKQPAATPLNPAPLTTAVFEQPMTEPGVERCFVVRAAERRGTLLIEGAPSPPQCVIPRDTFAPAAPTGFNGVPNPGVIDLRWDANAELDLAGYVVLRGEAPGDKLQALTPEPIRETRYADKSVKPGVRYVYAVVAVDKATPPNTSAQSARIEIAAR